MAKEEKSVYRLKKPLKIGSETIKELHFDEPRAEHFWEMGLNPNLGDLMKVAAKMTGMMEAEIKRLGFEDMMGVADIVGKHIAPIQTTGEKPSD
jgi:hypothetical protein